jgi:predicted O-linked N-acetylglucosamine transferase (SPINDLY family)
MSSAYSTPKRAPERAPSRPPVAPAPRRHALAQAAYLRGLEWAKGGRWAEAAQAYAEAVERNPDDAVFWLNLADARIKLGETEPAVHAARRALELDPDSELAVAIAAHCLVAANRYDETVALLHGADLERMRSSSPHFALGNALTQLHRYREAIDAYLASIRRKPDFMPAHAHLGNAFERARMHEEARECFQTAIALGGDRTMLLSAMGYQSMLACRWDLFAQDYAALQAEVAAGRGQPVPFHLLTMPSTRRQQRAAGQAFWFERCGAVAPMARPDPRPPGRRLRVGYVSNDLFRHATAYLIADLLESHDRERVDVHVYSYGHDDGSPIRARIVQAAGAGFVEAARLSDGELAERVRHDDIDILVDLKGYTLGTRIGLFALHPARVQVNYLGYPGTLGAPCYEYIVGDPIVTPLAHQDDYSERIAQLPDCYQPNDRHRPIGPRPTRAACGLPEQGFVFCSFNTCYKITAAVFDRWCRLLCAVPGSVLWLYEANEQARPNLLREARQRGVDPARIVWAPHVDLAEHLGRLQLADLALDTLPVNAHTTASDALWAGVPMISTPGESFVARVCSSVLQAGGLGELVAPDGDGYERLALELAREPARLAALRARLARERETCALFDSLRHTRALEALYERMIGAWDRGEPPQPLPAAA